MEVSGVVVRQAQPISGDLFNNTHSSKHLFSGRSIRAGKWVSGDLSFTRSRDFLGVSCSSGFSDNGHLQYYVSPPRCGVKKEIVKKEKKAIKKKLKLAKGLMKNLSSYSEMGFPEIVVDDSIGNQQEDKEKMISSTTELLLAQLEKLKAGEKEIKRKHKEEKAKLKALKMESKVESSSSSSSESSDSDCGGGQVINMKSLRTKRRNNTALLEPPRLVDDVSTQSQAEIKEETSLIISSSLVVADELKMLDQNSLRSEQQQCCSSSSRISNGEVGVEGMMSVTVGTSAERIDVCMGGKCKKLGAAALLEEFKTKVGIESAVVGCKCMGKCKSAPNVRVSNNQIEGGGGGGDTSVRASPSSNNPLYIGVGLEDVSAIVANFFGEEEEEKAGIGSPHGSCLNLVDDFGQGFEFKSIGSY